MENIDLNNNDVLIFNNLQESLNIKNCKTYGLEKLKKEIYEYVICEDHDINLMDLLVNREILLNILDSIQEGVEIADYNGIIKYVNPSFLKMLNLKKEDRLNKSVFEVSPDGSLAYSLKNKECVSDLVNFPKGTSIKLVSSSTPLYIGNEMIGAISTMRDQKEIFSLIKRLKKSEDKVRNLSEKIHNLSNAKYSFDDFKGLSEATKKVKLMAKKATFNDSIVLIQGETGTGKEILANAIHNGSYRAEKPFVSINCAAVQDTLLESEFFGYEKGAFTGAQKKKLGQFELADQGTIFLDEISEMSINLQAKLLRVIQERKIQRVGGVKKIDIDVRIIAATNRNLENLIEEGKFRKDLFYRLDVWEILIPPLRKRKEDIKTLINHILEKKFTKIGKKFIPMSEQAYQLLYNYDWPGNVRELENVLERAVIHCSGNEIIPDDLKLNLNENKIQKNFNGIMTIQNAEKQLIKNAIDKYGISYNSKLIIADKLGVSLATLYNKIKKYNLK